MADVTIIQPANGRPVQTFLGDGQPEYNRRLTGVATFPTTAASGTLIVPGLTKIAPGGVRLVPFDTPVTVKEMLNIPLGTLSATHGFTFRFPHAGTVTAVAFTAKEALAADNTNHYTFRLTNKGAAGAGSTAIIIADASNSTDADSTPVGFSIAAYTPKSLFLSATAADLVVAAGDVAEFTATEGGAAASFTEALLTVTVDIGGTDETLHCAADSSGVIAISSGKITINRTGNVKTSALKFAFEITGR